MSIRPVGFSLVVNFELQSATVSKIFVIEPANFHLFLSRNFACIQLQQFLYLRNIVEELK